jgi:hypothetical protein
MDSVIPFLLTRRLPAQGRAMPKGRISKRSVDALQCPATIATVQLYAGGCQCFVFRPSAITPELRRRILESICIIHNAAFELAFMQHHWGAMPGRFHCTMQAAGRAVLLTGIDQA